MIANDGVQHDNRMRGFPSSGCYVLTDFFSRDEPETSLSQRRRCPMRTSRRSLLRWSIATPFVLSTVAQKVSASHSNGVSENNTGSPVLSEPARQTPVVEETDVIVCGAGPAGTSAAIAAARCGAKVRLLEVHGCLGGVWTAGLLSWILDAGNKKGIIQQIVTRLQQRDAIATYPEGAGNAV